MRPCPWANLLPMPDSPHPILTRDNILNGELRGLLRARDPSMAFLTDEQLQQSRAAILEGHGGGDLWVFAYGSLIWNPAFHYAERRRGRLFGYHRRFCLRSHLGRGSRENPGLVLGLEAGGSCSGLAYRIAEAAIEEETWVLWRREMVVGSYVPRWVSVEGAGPARRAVAFVMNKEHQNYAGRLSQGEVARTLATAEGFLGRACDYLFEILSELEAQGLEDHRLSAIAREVRRLQA